MFSRFIRGVLDVFRGVFEVFRGVFDLGIEKQRRGDDTRFGLVWPTLEQALPFSGLRPNRSPKAFLARDVSNSGLRLKVVSSSQATPHDDPRRVRRSVFAVIFHLNHSRWAKASFFCGACFLFAQLASLKVVSLSPF